MELSDEDTARLKEMVKAIRTEFPAMYFETKFERPVYLNEMAGAVVPENTDKDILDALDAAGIPYRTYGAAEERPQVIRKFSEELEGVRFSTNGEKARIREQARRDGTYLKAPNGQPSKLTADQCHCRGSPQQGTDPAGGFGSAARLHLLRAILCYSDGWGAAAGQPYGGGVSVCRTGTGRLADSCAALPCSRHTGAFARVARCRAN